MQAEHVDKLVYEISSKFDSGITPSEARALIPTPDETRSLAWLREVLADVAIDSELLGSLDSIDFSRFHDVGVCILKSGVYVFFHDDLRQEVFFKNIDDQSVLPANQFLNTRLSNLDQAREKPVLIRFFRRSDEAMATVPGIETHWFFGPLWKYRGYFIQAGVASLLTNLFAVGTSLFAMVVYNRIIPSNAMTSLMVLVIGMAILLLADYAVKTARSKLLGVAGVESDLTIADRLFTQVLDIQYKAKKGSVGHLANVLKEYEQIREFFTSATLVSLIDLPFAVIFVVFIWFLGGPMVYPVLIGIGLLFAVTVYMQPRMKKVAERALQDAHNKHSVLVEALSGLETVKALGAGGLLRRRFRSVIGKQAAISEETKRQSFFATNLTQETQQAVQIGVVAVGALSVSQGEFGFGAIIACTILSGKALLPFAQLAQLLSRLNQIVSGYRSLAELMGQPVEHDANRKYIKRGRYSGEIAFADVDFYYPDQSGKALNQVSFHIKAGEKVAIVGRVGSGKTTVGKLITRLYEASSGSVVLDGVRIEQLAPSEVRENVGFVSQEPWLIAGTLEQNIMLGAATANTEDMLWAAEISGVEDFANMHPDGLKQSVAERGEGLSGGQRQAISIARALVRKPPILLLDEPTSAMDAHSEKKFIQRFQNQNFQCTLVVITHRTSLLSFVDRVIVLDEGRVVGSGSVEAFLNARQHEK